MSAIIKAVETALQPDGSFVVKVIDADDAVTTQAVPKGTAPAAVSAASDALAKQVKQTSAAKGVIRDPKGVVVADDGITAAVAVEVIIQ